MAFGYIPFSEPLGLILGWHLCTRLKGHETKLPYLLVEAPGRVNMRGTVFGGSWKIPPCSSWLWLGGYDTTS